MSLNIDLTKVDEKIVDKYLRKFNITANGKLASKVNALEKHQRIEEKGGRTKASDISAPCDDCGGESDMNLPECPYCGASNDDVPTDLASANGASSRATDEVDAPTSEPLHEPEHEPPSDDEDRGEPLADEPEEKSATEPTADPPTAVVEDAPMAKTTTKGKQKLAKVERAAKPIDAHGAELVPTKELDDAVEAVHAALRQGATSYWDLGRALIEIFDKQLWKQRVEGGRQQHASWNLFCRDELGMSHANTFSIMDAARAFSKKDFEDLGHTRLSLMLRLPKDRQLELAEEARKGRLPRARLKEILADEVPAGQRRDTGRTKRGAGNAAPEKVAARRAEKERRVLPKPDGELTAVSQLGRTKLKMWARPNAKKPNEKPSRAVSLTQDPWVEEQLVNGVVVKYVVMKTATGIELVIERRRAD